MTGRMPLGAKPPRAVRLATLAAPPGHRPSTYAPAANRNATIAATLIEANQNSNSPNDLTDTRLVTVSDNSNTRLMSQVPSPGSQKRTREAPATAASATAKPQKSQYIQPVRKPASSPSRGRSLKARRAYS